MMNKRFSGQIAAITGGADGLGKAIGNRLACEGAMVILMDKNLKKLEETLSEFKNSKLDVSGINIDISVEKSVEEVFRDLEKKHSKLDILINAAGIVGPTNTSITQYETKEYDRVYEVNLRGAFLITKYGLGLMEKNGYGRILLISSIAGKEGNPFMVGYSSMKAGVIGLVKAVGKEYATKGVTINGLAPAVIKTAMNSDTAPEQLKYMTDKIPMGRLGTVSEVASIASWIVSQEASFSTGFIFDLSGGRATY